MQQHRGSGSSQHVLLDDAPGAADCPPIGDAGTLQQQQPASTRQPRPAQPPPPPQQQQQQQEQQQQEQQQQQQPASRSDAVDGLRQELSELRALVDAQRTALAAQQRALDTQARDLRQLRAELSAAPLAAPQRPLDAQLVGDPAAAAPPRPFDVQRAALSSADRRLGGEFDWRFHSTGSGAVPPDPRVLPKRIILVRHAESEGNVDASTYSFVPDPAVALSEHGHEQARAAGEAIRSVMEAATGGTDRTAYSMFFFVSPYRRCRETYNGIRSVFSPTQVAGMQEEVQLREQDFGNLQDAAQKEREKLERLKFNRFFFRFDNGESGADVYDRITQFQDHLVRDLNAGRFNRDTSLCLVTHGLALRIFLMRWFHWSVDAFLHVWNPKNAVPIVLERVDSAFAYAAHTKCLYRLSAASMAHLEGCTPAMCSTGSGPCLPDGSWVPPAALEAWECEEGPAGEEAEAVEAASGGGAPAGQWAQLGGGWEGEGIW